MTRKQLFEETLARAQNAYTDDPTFFPLKSVVAQLTYLVALVKGNESDSSRLGAITLGVVAACEMANTDAELEELLAQCQLEAEKMYTERLA